MKRALVKLWFWSFVVSVAGASGAGCGGSTSCSEDIKIACQCDDGTEGFHVCEDGAYSACQCETIPEGLCRNDAECSDGAFCNGIEICDPENAEANAHGCLPAAGTPFCDDGVDCTENGCDSLLDRCVFRAPDNDGDGYGDASCLDTNDNPVGDDCDDNDPDRFPTNFEICDEDHLDEDCDDSTFGWLDEDGDGSVSDACCNGKNCGDDCNDKNIAQRPLQPEFCDKVDNNCDGKVDNNTIEVPWYRDLDGDGFGEAGKSVLSCTPIEGRSLLKTDCAPQDPARHPAQQEICDLKDNNCNGRADEGPLCGAPEGYPFDDSELAGTGGADGAGGGGNSGGAGSGGGENTGGSNGSGGSGAVTPDVMTCGDRDLTGATVVSSVPAGDITWSGKIHLQTNVTVNGRTLTILPGTEIYVDPGLKISVGQFAQPQGTVDIAGTEEAPIKFCGTSATPGHWAGLDLNNLSSDSEFSWVLIADGGAGASSTAAALTVSTPVDLVHVHVTGAASSGIMAARFGSGSTDLVATQNAGYPMTVTTEAALGETPPRSYFLENDEDYIYINDGVWATADVTLFGHGTPYLLKGGLSVDGSIDVVFEAGSELVLDEEQTFRLAWNSAAPKLLIQGTPENPVVISGKEPGVKYWGHFEILGSTNSESRIDHLIVRDGGSTAPAFQIYARIPVNNLSIEDCKTQGLRLGAAGLAPGSSGIHISDIDGEFALVAPASLVDLPSDSTFSGANPARILVEGVGTASRSGTIKDFGVPYYSESNMRGDGAADVTFEAGVEFLFGNGSSLTLGYNGGAMTARMLGTAAKPVVFRHVANLDASWSGVIATPTISLDSVFHYVEIHDTNATGALSLSRNLDADHITNSSFESTGYCINHPYGAGTYSGNGNNFSQCGGEP